MRGRKAWPRKLGALMMALALCVGLLPVSALAAGEDSWEHTSGVHTDWTELTADELSKCDYTLGDGKYYLSSTEREYDDIEYYEMTGTQTIIVNGNVTLCLNDVHYNYGGSNGPLSPLIVVVR